MQINTVLKHVDLDENGGCGRSLGSETPWVRQLQTTVLGAVRSGSETGVLLWTAMPALPTRNEQYAKLRIELRLNAVGRLSAVKHESNDAGSVGARPAQLNDKQTGR
jgi:hypothetical protein